MAMRKRFGQHFLRDPQIVGRIIDLITPPPDNRVVEIGPGEGALTLPLLQRGVCVDAIEIDRDLAARLPSVEPAAGRLRVFCEDALAFDFASLADARAIRLIGNLPYNISTALLFRLMRFRPCIGDMYFMLQREVAHGLAAPAGAADYSRLSVMAAYCFETAVLFDVPPAAFHPPPAVVSAFVRMLPRPGVSPEKTAALDALVKRAFSKRRKTIANALAPLFDEAAWRRMNINPAMRPDAVCVDDYLRMVEYLSLAPSNSGE